MPFDKDNLVASGGQSKAGMAPQRFAYRTADTLATVAAANYFLSHRSLFKVGDMIDVVQVDNADTPTQVIATGTVLVQSSTATGINTVDISTGPYTGGLIRMPFFFNETDLLAPTSQMILSPVAGTLKRLVTCVKKQVTTGGDIGVSLAGTAVPGLTVTVANSAAVGTVQEGTPTSVTRLTADQAIAVTAAAAFATAGAVFGFVEIVPDVDIGDIYVPFFINATDLSAGTSQWVPSPVAGQIVHAAAVTQVAVVTGGAITVELATVAVAGLSVVVADAAAVGDVDSDDPTSLTGATGAVANEQSIEIVVASAFDGGGAVNGYVTVRPTVRTKSAFLFFYANETDVLAPTSHYVPSPIRGKIHRAVTSTQVAVGTGGDVTFEQANVAVLGLTVTVANSAAAGDIDRDNATAGDITADIAANSAVEVVFGSAFATTGALNGFIEVQPV